MKAKQKGKVIPWTMYYCQGDGGQWNVNVTIVLSLSETMLKVVRATKRGTLIGLLGTDGRVYAIVPDCDLYDSPQD